MDAKTLTLKTFTTHTVIFSRKNIMKCLQILMANGQGRGETFGYILCLSPKFQNIDLLFLNLNSVQISSFPKKSYLKKANFVYHSCG